LREILLFISLLFFSCTTREKKELEKGETSSPLNYVNLFLGTGGGGFGQANLFPGPTLPWGMVQPGPDTHGGPLGRFGFAHTAGYWYYDTKIEGFSQVHLSGTGIADGGYITLMPVYGFNDAKRSLYGYAEEFSHKDEYATPGYYRVTLKNGIQVELTATYRVAFHRYTFPSSGEPSVILDLSHTLGFTGKVPFYEYRLLSRGEFQGRIRGEGEFVGGRGISLFFFGELIPPPEKTLPLDRDDPDRGVVFLYPQGTTQVEIRIALSYVEEDSARLNYDTEGRGRSFDEVVTSAKKIWEEHLGKVKVEGGVEEEKVLLYTAHYRSMMMPQLLTDVDGRFRDIRGEVTRAEGFTYYSNFSLWDTYRGVHSLYNLLFPEKQRDFLLSLLHMGKTLGYLPRWPLGTVETGTMVGTPADILFSEAYQKGIRSFPVEDAIPLMVRGAQEVSLPTRPFVDQYCLLGYVPYPAGGSVSLTLEYAYADHAIARLLYSLGREEEGRRFENQSRRYRTLFHRESGSFQPKNARGDWVLTSLKTAWDPSFVEGNTWHYLWMMIWDKEGYEEFFGGREGVLNALRKYFSLSMEEETPTFFLGSAPIQFPRVYFWPGNEPSIFAPVFFGLWDGMGSPYGGEEILRWVVKTFFKNTPDGIPGNDDGGTQSTYLFFYLIGIFPVPGEDTYIPLSPFFRAVTIQTPEGEMKIPERYGWGMRRFLDRFITTTSRRREFCGFGRGQPGIDKKFPRERKPFLHS